MNGMWTLHHHVLVLAALLAAAACDGTGRKTRQACESSTECGGGVCFESFCYQACTDQADCGVEDVCVRKTTGSTDVTVCETAADFAGCTTDPDCEDLGLVAGNCERAACDTGSGTCGVVSATDPEHCAPAAPATSSRVLMDTEAPGANCASGGVAVHTYFDANGDGALDASEVIETTYVCHGAAGVSGEKGDAGPAGHDGLTTLVRTTALAPGDDPTCPTGGTKVEAGLDGDGNGDLTAAEVDSTALVCNGRDDEAGASCTVLDNGDGTKTLTCGDATVTLSDGHDGAQGPKGADGASCTVTDNGDGTATLTCGDSSVTVSGGQNGADGQDGSSCTVVDNGDGTKTIACTDGTSVTVADGQDGADGADGAPGQDGADGANGQDGASCTVADNGDGTKTITCGASSVTVSDGQNGADGQAGASCTVVDNGDGSRTMSCPDGSSVTF